MKDKKITARQKRRRNKTIANICATAFFIVSIFSIYTIVEGVVSEKGISGESISGIVKGNLGSNTSQVDLGEFMGENESASKAEDSKSSAKDKSSSSSSSSQATKAKAPILVNRTNKVPKGYNPNVVAVSGEGGYQLNKTAAAAYVKMRTAAARDGINIWMVSGYRSLERQEQLFYSRYNEYKRQGYSDKQAFDKTALYTAVPGTSEHSLGLAVDISSIEGSFESTKQFKWLYKNCATYGFILRYPKDKTQITKIAFEPWHYRYVGKTIATKIMKEKLCLEEYIKKYC